MLNLEHSYQRVRRDLYMRREQPWSIASVLVMPAAYEMVGVDKSALGERACLVKPAAAYPRRWQPHASFRFTAKPTSNFWVRESHRRPDGSTRWT